MPDRGRNVRRIYWNAVTAKRQLVRAVHDLFSEPGAPDPERVYWIDPKRIRLHTNWTGTGADAFDGRVFDMRKFRGATVDGDWDLSPYLFTDLDAYKAIAAVIREGARWQDTPFFRKTMQEIDAGNVLWGCTSREDLERRCRYLDQLVQSVRENGYRRSFECRIGDESKGDHPITCDEVTVNIGRNGQYLFQDGRHRLAIALVLGINRIPVRVLVRHAQWEAFRKQLQGMVRDGAAAGTGGSLYQPCIHPDLADLPAYHECEDRYQAIERNLPSRGGTVLDIGANLGYFCHRLEDLGFECTAVEYGPEIASTAEKLRIAEGKRFTVICDDILDPHVQSRVTSDKIDVVLALSIFHHFLKTRTAHDDLVRFLQTLRADSIFFEPHLPHELQMAGAYANYTEAEFVAFMQQHCRLPQADPIYRAADGRTLYRLHA